MVYEQHVLILNVSNLKSTNISLNISDERLVTIIVSKTDKYFEYCSDEHHLYSKNIIIFNKIFFRTKNMLKVSTVE